MKPWYKSKMIWLNVAVAVFAILEAVLGNFQALLPESTFVILLAIVSSINVVLRTITSQALGWEQPKVEQE